MAVPAVQRSQVIGGYTFTGDELTNMKHLVARPNGDPSTIAFKDPASGTSYVVPSGKRLRVVVCITHHPEDGLRAHGLGYADTAATGTDPGTAVFYGGVADGPILWKKHGTSHPAQPTEIPMQWIIPAGKYPFGRSWNAGGTNVMNIYGVEESV